MTVVFHNLLYCDEMRFISFLDANIVVEDDDGDRVGC